MGHPDGVNWHMAALGKLNEIQLSGFKSIKDMNLELGALNIMIGPNGAGKSNFINFFKFVNKIIEKNLQFYVSQQLGADKILHFGRKTTDMIKCSLEFTPNSYSFQLAPDTGGGLVFQEERVRFYGDQVGYKGGTKTYSLGQPGSRESKLPNRASTATPAGHVVGYIQDWKVYHFHDTSESAKVKQPGRISQSDSLLPQADNLAAFLRSIRETASYLQITRNIQRIAPFFLDFVLEPERENPDLIKLRWKHRSSEEYFDASDFSDGTLRFVCLTTLLLQPKLPTIILLDEPELGLHPYAIQLLAGMIKSVAQQTQIIASTQSVTLANQFDWSDLIIVDRVQESTIFRRLNEKDVEAWLGEFAVGELWEKNVIGGTP